MPPVPPSDSLARYELEDLAAARRGGTGVATQHLVPATEYGHWHPAHVRHSAREHRNPRGLGTHVVQKIPNFGIPVLNTHQVQFRQPLQEALAIRIRGAQSAPSLVRTMVWRSPPSPSPGRFRSRECALADLLISSLSQRCVSRRGFRRFLRCRRRRLRNQRRASRHSTKDQRREW